MAGSIRTIEAYNLAHYDVVKTAGKYNMPSLKACNTILAQMLDFNQSISIKPRKNTAVHFYIDDYRFERIWKRPDFYCKKLLAWGATLTPDFSLYMDMPLAMKIWNVYRSRLIGQILQNDGGEVIPTLSWAEKATFEFAFDGIEPGGVVSVSTIGVKRSKEARKIWHMGMDEAIQRLKPSAILVYGGDIGYKFPCKAVYFENTTIANIKRRKDGRTWSK